MKGEDLSLRGRIVNSAGGDISGGEIWQRDTGSCRGCRCCLMYLKHAQETCSENLYESMRAQLARLTFFCAQVQISSSLLRNMVALMDNIFWGGV